MFLMEQHIPDQVRLQPLRCMNSPTARALRPLLNRWLGNISDPAGDFNRNTGSSDGRGGQGKAQHLRPLEDVAGDVLLGQVVRYHPASGNFSLLAHIIDRPAPGKIHIKWFKGDGEEEETVCSDTEVEAYDARRDGDKAGFVSLGIAEAGVTGVSISWSLNFQ